MVPYLQTLIESEPLFLGLSETWLNKGHFLAPELRIEGCKILWTDSSRPKSQRGRQSGGVAFTSNMIWQFI